MDVESDAESIDLDEDVEDALPICVQGSLTRLKDERSKLCRLRNSLKAQLNKSHQYAEELEKQVKALQDKVHDLEQQLENCVQCKKLQLQLDEVGERLGSGQLSFMNPEVASVGVQTDEDQDNHEEDWETEGNIIDQVKKTANNVMEQQGMVYEETSGLYYDYKSGYYFDAGSGLYYDGHHGIWYQYDPETRQYRVNSREPEEEVVAQKILSQAAREAMEARRKKEENKRKKKKKSETPDLAEAIDNLNSVLAKHDYSDESDDDNDPVDTIPCVRIVVTATEDPEVVVGSLFLVTCKGGSIGSRGHHEVLLADKGCSKHHARLSFNNGKYFLKDLGSRNGTWVGGKRISVSKQESEDVEIGHGTLVQIGKTKLLCHLHPGRETCLQCEPGVVRVENKDLGKGSKEEVRKENLLTLKRKYGLDNPGEDVLKTHEKNKNDFYDRAKERRRLIGSVDGNEKTVTASVDVALGADNKGFKMLEKMGFKAGSQKGLGKHNQGRSEPIKVEQRSARSGLGSTTVAGGGNLESKKNAIWLKTQKRFTNVKVLDAFNQNDTDEDDDNSQNKNSS